MCLNLTFSIFSKKGLDLLDIYLYQLDGVKQPLLSVSIGIDLSYWKERGKSITGIMPATTINQAMQLLKKGKIDFRPPVKSPQLDWHNYECVAEQLFAEVTGRAYLYDELLSIFQQRNPVDLSALLQVLYLQKKTSIQPGVEWGRFLLFARCNRCYATSSYLCEYPCATCGERCMMCNHCYLLGRSRSCTPFFCFSENEKKVKRSVTLDLPYSLTLGQQKVANQIQNFFGSKGQQLLLWAVTGAGKTECMLQAIKTYLEQGKRVIWVTPRKDVVIELAPRLQRLFPQERVLALHGGSQDRFVKGSIAVSTAHQAYRYYQKFDLGIVDEVDAFPLYQNQMLESGIQRALTADAKQIFLTATPPRNWKRYVKTGKLASVSLPVRYHGYPLPVPELKLERRLWKRLKTGEPQVVLYAFVKQVIATVGQAMIFVPRVKDLFVVQHWLCRILSIPHSKIAIVYAKDHEREEKVRLFRQGKIQFLVSTTILERGVTVARSHVAVVGADHMIFDWATLVQIAGRVGRSRSYQQGVVWLIAQEKTREQMKAIQEIEKMNELAVKKGFLRPKDEDGSENFG